MIELMLSGNIPPPVPVIFDPNGGQLLFTTAGVHLIEVDNPVTISMVCVGASFRGGGGTSYRNNVSLVKGQLLEVTVGGLSNTELLSQVTQNGVVRCIALGPTGTNFEIGGLGGKAASNVNTGGGNGGDALYNGAYNLGFGGAGGYSGKGGDSGIVNSSWAPVSGPQAGTGGGGGGGHGGYNSPNLYRGSGGGVSLTPPNGTLLSGAAGTWVTSNNTVRNGRRGSDRSTNIISSEYGGGRGVLTAGAVRIMWGAGRSYPNNNTADI